MTFESVSHPSPTQILALKVESELYISVPSILLKFSDQKTGSRRVVGWHKKSEKSFGFILPIKPRLRWVPEVYAVKMYFSIK